MLLEQCEAGDFRNEELRKQAGDGATDEEIILRAWSHSGDEGLATLYFLSDNEAELEKLYVPHGQRRTGVASTILTAVEDFCRGRKITRLKLWANPLDDDTDQLWLIEWYKKRGYRENGEGLGELERIL